MISQFKPSSRSGLIALATVVATLCVLTFTKAADSTKRKPAMDVGSAQKPDGSAARANATEIDRLWDRVNDLEHRIRDQEEIVDKLKAELGISNEMAESGRASTLEPEIVRVLERERISTEARGAQYQRLFEELKAGSESLIELAQVVPTAVPDTELSRLLADLNQAEASFDKYASELGPDQPQMKALAVTITTLRSQINARVKGILKGLEAQAAAQKATVESISKQLAEAAKRDINKASDYRSFFRAKRDLEILERVRDDLKRQALVKQFGPIEPAPSKPEPKAAEVVR